MLDALCSRGRCVTIKNMSEEQRIVIVVEYFIEEIKVLKEQIKHLQKLLKEESEKASIIHQCEYCRSQYIGDRCKNCW